MRNEVISRRRAGFQRIEFQRLISLAFEYPIIKDSRPYQDGDYACIAFHFDATKSPALWIEKYRNGPHKSLYVAHMLSATSGGRINDRRIGSRADKPTTEILQLVRSEKFDRFLELLRVRMAALSEMSQAGRTAGHNIRFITPFPVASA